MKALKNAIVIDGGYVRQVYPFTEAEDEELARKVLSNKRITQLHLVEAERAVEKARRATEFTAEDYEKWKEDMLTTLSVTGVAGERHHPFGQWRLEQSSGLYL